MSSATITRLGAACAGSDHSHDDRGARLVLLLACAGQRSWHRRLSRPTSHARMVDGFGVPGTLVPWPSRMMARRLSPNPPRGRASASRQH
jgi:hypothetical protein